MNKFRQIIFCAHVTSGLVGGKNMTCEKRLKCRRRQQKSPFRRHTIFYRAGTGFNASIAWSALSRNWKSR